MYKRTLWYVYYDGKWETFKSRKKALDRLFELRIGKIHATLEYETYCG